MHRITRSADSAPLQCGTAEGRLSLGFCGPILSSIGFFWWLAYAAAATAAAVSASQWESFAYLAPYRTGERRAGLPIRA